MKAPYPIFPPATAQENADLTSSTEEANPPDLTACQCYAPDTSEADVEGGEPVEGLAGKPQYEWQMELGLDRNFHAIGKLLSSLEIGLFQHHEGGLLVLENHQPRHVTSAKELAPLLIDTVRISVTKNGKYHGEKPSDSVLNNMLRSRSFLSNFRKVEDLVTKSVVLADLSPSQPGFNEGGILQLGPLVPTRDGFSTITKFLDVMGWESNADRTNAVAALLTVPFRRHFLGGKPLILITAGKSHSGKSTLSDFIRGGTTKVDLPYENIDWPMQRSLHEQLQDYPEAEVINFDNVRIDDFGRGKIIRSGLVESFITNSEVVLSSTRGKPMRLANRFVFLLNSNGGALSIDLLNWSLPIRFAPSGDVLESSGRWLITTLSHCFPIRREKSIAKSVVL